MSRRRILLVDDSDEDATMFARGAAATEGELTIERARTSAEALRSIAGSLPDLLVLDCHLGPDCGLELLRLVKDLTPHLPIVMLSGTSRPMDVSLAYAGGANSFLRKPHDFDGYLACVRNLVDYWLNWNCGSLERGIARSGCYLR